MFDMQVKLIVALQLENEKLRNTYETKVQNN